MAKKPSRTISSFSECSQTSETEFHSDQHIPFYKLLLRWLITLHGDKEINDSRGYISLPNTTNYIFLLGGRFRTVRNARPLSVVVLVIIIIPMVLFSIFETDRLWNLNGGNAGYRALVVLFYYSWASNIASFVRTATSDPGILPKNIHLPNLNDHYRIPQEYYNLITLPTDKSPEQNITVKYCRTCRIWRPPRTSHCSICNVCVMVHDHHCIWVNNCIGKRNYRYFLTFLFSAVLTSLFLIAACAVVVAQRQSPSTTLPATLGVAIFLITYGSLTIWYPAILFVYHVFMAGRQMTTREFLRDVGYGKNPVFHRMHRNISKNPYDRGSFFKNLIHLFCQQRGPSLVNPRERHAASDWRFMDLNVEEEEEKSNT